MARGRREGVLIAGGGIAGCLAALAMARFRPEIPLLIVEEKARFGGDRFRALFAAEIEGEERALVAPIVGQRWPGYYVAFPGLSRKFKAELGGIAPDAVHKDMVSTLRPDQYRLGTKVVAVREDALVLDGGEEIKAEGAIDARGAANLSMLDLLYEARLERDYKLAAPHGIDRPVLVDATAETGNGLAFIQLFPLGPDRLLVADVAVSERAAARRAGRPAARPLCRAARLGEGAGRRPNGRFRGRCRSAAISKPSGGSAGRGSRGSDCAAASSIPPPARPSPTRRGPPCCSPRSTNLTAPRCTMRSRRRPSGSGGSASRCARSTPRLPTPSPTSGARSSSRSIGSIRR